jgi:hypothetical protein
MRSKPSSKQSPKIVTPLDARKNDLAAQEARLHDEIARRQKLIAEAPRLAEQAARRRREELIQRKSRGEARFGSPLALADKRFGYEANAATPSRSLRKHRNQGMFTFFLLCVVLAAVLVWLYTKVIGAA